jgi:hypothetical protein
MFTSNASNSAAAAAVGDIEGESGKFTDMVE